ncbi:hypothetical protein ATY27_13745 [Rheinheimera sp. F8]|nr:hypothetical protein ATY27_13745 [Rheinheimera sp. F8]
MSRVQVIQAGATVAWLFETTAQLQALLQQKNALFWQLQRFAGEPVFQRWYTGAVKSFQLAALDELQPDIFNAVFTFIKQQLPDTYCTLKQLPLLQHQRRFLADAGHSSYRYVLLAGPTVEAVLPQQQLVARYLMADEFEPFARVFLKHQTMLDGFTSPHWPHAWADQWLLLSAEDLCCSEGLKLSRDDNFLQLTGLGQSIHFYQEKANLRSALTGSAATTEAIFAPVLVHSN